MTIRAQRLKESPALSSADLGLLADRGHRSRSFGQLTEEEELDLRGAEPGSLFDEEVGSDRCPPQRARC
jgi:hypothetical protein